MTFLSPGRLWLLLALAVLAAVYVVQARRRASYTVRFTELELLASVAPKRPGWRRHVPAGLVLLSLVSLTVGFARPQGKVSVPADRATILVALDVSLSMDATDVAPSRIAAAKAAAATFVANLPDRFNVGLVAFSGSASLVVAPTRDHRSVQQAVQRLSLGAGTAIGEAVLSSLGSIASVPGDGGSGPPPARIVLLSDGTNTVGRPIAQAVTAAVQAAVPVSTIAFGTQDGTVDVDGQRIKVPVDRDALRQLASDTKGKAYTAESGGALSDVYKDVSSQVGTTRQQREITARFTGLGLLALAGAAALSMLWGVRLP